MKKCAIIVLYLFASSLVFSEGLTILKGDIKFLKLAKSVYVEVDFSKTTIDALSSEEGYIEYHTKNKEKADKDPAKWLEGWNKDKKGLRDAYVAALQRSFKKYPVSFNGDNTKSDYKMVLQPLEIKTGNAVVSSSIIAKIFVYETSSNKLVTEIKMPVMYGTQQGPMSPTVGMRLNLTVYYIASYLSKYAKKTLK